MDPFRHERRRGSGPTAGYVRCGGPRRGLTACHSPIFSAAIPLDAPAARRGPFPAHEELNFGAGGRGGRGEPSPGDQAQLLSRPSRAVVSQSPFPVCWLRFWGLPSRRRRLGPCCSSQVRFRHWRSRLTSPHRCPPVGSRPDWCPSTGVGSWLLACDLSRLDLYLSFLASPESRVSSDGRFGQ